MATEPLRGSTPEPSKAAQDEEGDWATFFDMFGHARFRRLVALLSRIPSDPRCEVCGSPFGGFGGRLMRRMGKAPSRKNPRWCDLCFEKSPQGGMTMTIGVMFADIRGSTALGERLTPAELAELLNRFYWKAARIILRHGLIDKFIGDEVMGIYIPPLSPDGKYADAMVSDAFELLDAVADMTVGHQRMRVGIGLDTGPAFIGKVGEGELRDFTAIGDVVNTASRLQHAAVGGDVVMSEAVAQLTTVDLPSASALALELKGKANPVAAVRVRR